LRVRIIFNLKVKGGSVPFHHQFLLAQFIKGVLIRGGDDLLKENQAYNFSALKGQTRIGRNGLHYYSKKVTLVFSCSEQSFLDYFLKNLFALPKVEIGSLILVPESVELEACPQFISEMKFICISPLVLVRASFDSEKSKEFISPSSDQFLHLLIDKTRERMGLETSVEYQDFQVYPDEDYLAKMKAEKKKFARIYPLYDQDVKYEVRGYTFPFTLKAPEEFHSFVYTCGFGAYANKGFGMLDITNEDYTRETSDYIVEV